jgi:hypothetical protein
VKGEAVRTSLVWLISIGLLCVGGCGAGEQPRSGGQGSRERSTGNDKHAASDAPGYESMRELVGDSPVVVLGRLTDISRDESACPGIPDPACVPWYATFDVEEQLAGPPMGKLRILYYGHDEEPAQHHWGRVGDRALQFLTDEIRGSYHRPQAMFTIAADGLVEPWGLHYRYEDAVRGEPWAEVRRQVVSALGLTVSTDDTVEDDVPSSGSDTDKPSVEVAPTPCREVPRSEPPQDHGVDSTFDPETNLIEIWYTVEGRNRHHTLDYLNDSSCSKHPLLKKLITHIVETAAQNYPQEPPPPPPWQEPPT